MKMSLRKFPTPFFLKRNQIFSSLLLPFLLFCFFSANQINAQNYADITWKLVPNLSSSGSSGFIEYDNDQDGIKELFYATNATSYSYIKSLEYTSGSYAETYISEYLPFNIRWIEKHDLENDGEADFYLLASNYKLYVFDPVELTFKDSIILPYYTLKFSIKDIQNDGTYEIVAISDTKAFILDLSGNQLLQKSLSNVSNMSIGNVDLDPEEELIISGNSNGYVLNLENLSEEWVLTGGFGSNMLLYDSDYSGVQKIYGYNNNYIIAYDAISQSSVWQLDPESGVSKFNILDINNDGLLEILVASSFNNNGLITYSLNAQNLLWEMDVPGDPVGGISQIILSDMNGDGTDELVYGCPSGIVAIANTYLHTNEWVSLDYSRGFALDFYDYNNDGNADCLFTSQTTDNDYNSGATLILDGLTKETLFGPYYPYQAFQVYDISMTTVGGIKYLLNVLSDRFFVTNTETGTFVQQVVSQNSLKYGEFYYPPDATYPRIIVSQTSGGIKVYKFINGTIQLDWSTISNLSFVSTFKVGDYDDDPNKELAFLADGSVHIYDLETHLLEQQISLISITSGDFEIADQNADGQKELIYLAQSGSLYVVNLLTLQQTSHTIPDQSLNRIKLANLDDDYGLEIVMLTGTRLAVYDDDYTFLYGSGIINNTLYDNESLSVLDINNDQKMELVSSSQLGIYQFTLNTNFTDITLPFVLNVFPTNGTEHLSTDSPITVSLSEDMDPDDLINDIAITDESGNPQLFEATFDENSNLLTIIPLTTWASGQNITITLLNTFSDTTGNPLDGNYNTVPNGIDDNYSWTIGMGTGIDLIGPVIKQVDIPEQIFAGYPIYYNGYTTDSSLISINIIADIQYFFDQPVLPGEGTSLAPSDTIFNEYTEFFSGSIMTWNLPVGVHSLSIIAKDTLGNWGQPVQFSFEILPDDQADWPSYSKDLLNTGANVYSELTFPLAYKYHMHHSNGINNYEITKAIVAHGRLIYGINSSGLKQMFCRDLLTGTLIWSKNFALSDEIYPAAYGNGYIYAQLGDHSDSKLGCYDFDTGNQVWLSDYSAQWMDAFGPMAYEDKVYILEGAYSSDIRAYNAFNGDLKWENVVNDNYNFDEWLPAIYNDTMYGFAEQLAVFGLQDGSTYYTVGDTLIPYEWEGYTMGSSIVVDTVNRQLIITSRDFTNAYSMDNHTINWSFPIEIGGSYLATPALIDGKLYYATKTKILEYNATSGQLLWQFDFSENQYQCYQPAVNNDILAVGTSLNTWIFDRNTHELKLHLPFGSSPVISRQHLIISANTGDIIVYENNPNPPVLSATIQPDNEILCFGDSTGVLSVIPTGGSGFGYYYNWNLPENNNASTITNVPAGVYNVTVTDLNNNSLVLTQELLQPDQMQLTDSQTPEVDGAMNGSAEVIANGGTPPYIYDWLESPDNTSSVLNNIGTGEYTVIVSDNNGCNSTITITVETITGILEKYDNIKVFPTLSHGIINILSEESLARIGISIARLDGTEIFYQELPDLFEYQIQLKEIPDGCYLLNFIYEDKIKTERILILRN